MKGRGEVFPGLGGGVGAAGLARQNRVACGHGVEPQLPRWGWERSWQSALAGIVFQAKGRLLDNNPAERTTYRIEPTWDKTSRGWLKILPRLVLLLYVSCSGATLVIVCCVPRLGGVSELCWGCSGALPVGDLRT